MTKVNEIRKSTQKRTTKTFHDENNHYRNLPT